MRRSARTAKPKSMDENYVWGARTRYPCHYSPFAAAAAPPPLIAPAPVETTATASKKRALDYEAKIAELEEQLSKERDESAKALASVKIQAQTAKFKLTEDLNQAHKRMREMEDEHKEEVAKLQKREAPQEQAAAAKEKLRDQADAAMKLAAEAREIADKCKQDAAAAKEKFQSEVAKLAAKLERSVASRKKLREDVAAQESLVLALQEQAAAKEKKLVRDLAESEKRVAALQLEQTNLQEQLKKRHPIPDPAEEEEKRTLCNKIHALSGNEKILKKDLDDARAYIKSVTAELVQLRDTLGSQAMVVSQQHSQANAVLDAFMQPWDRAAVLAQEHVARHTQAPITQYVMTVLRAIVAKPQLAVVDVGVPQRVHSRGNKAFAWRNTLRAAINQKPVEFMDAAAAALGVPHSRVSEFIPELFERCAPTSLEAVAPYVESLHRTHSNASAEEERLDWLLAAGDLTFLGTVQHAGVPPAPAPTRLASINAHMLVHNWEGVAHGTCALADVHASGAALDALDKTSGRVTVVTKGAALQLHMKRSSVFDLAGKIALLLDAQPGTHPVVPRPLAEAFAGAFFSKFNKADTQRANPMLCEFEAPLAARAHHKRTEVLRAEETLVCYARALSLVRAVKGEVHRILEQCRVLGATQ